MNLTLPKWLQSNVSITKQREITHDDSLKENSIEPVLNQEKDSLQQTTSLSYLDDYIQHYF